MSAKATGLAEALGEHPDGLEGLHVGLAESLAAASCTADSTQQVVPNRKEKRVGRRKERLRKERAAAAATGEGVDDALERLVEASIGGQRSSRSNTAARSKRTSCDAKDAWRCAYCSASGRKANMGKECHRLQQRFGCACPICAPPTDEDGAVVSTCRSISVAETAIHVVAVTSVEVCRAFIGLVQKRLEEQTWETERHAAFPTTDIEVGRIPPLIKPTQMLLDRVIFPSICGLYSLPQGCLSARELFIVKYSAGYGLYSYGLYSYGLYSSGLYSYDHFIVKHGADSGEQRALALHCDTSHFSFNLLLSDPVSEFVGGGTCFRP